MNGTAAFLFAAILASPPPAAPNLDPIRFEEIVPPGLEFKFDADRTARKYQPQTMLAGIALFDYDNDGRLDIFAVNGANILSQAKDKPGYSDRLFHNNGDGSFTDVTEKAGVAGRGYNFGIAIGDYDNDGYEDIFVAGLRRNTLFHNNGNGTFTDVTEKAGLAQPDPQYGTLWGVSAAWIDYNRDGRLDLFVSNYCVWDPATEPVCGLGGVGDFCHPRLYKPLPNSLFRNNGDGTFTDVSAASGIRRATGKGMGVAVADFDGDGWPDLFVANDTTPNSLFHNRRDGTFEEIAMESGVAYPETGEAISGMGVDARDIDNDGRPDVFETAIQIMTLFRNLGKGQLQEITTQSGLGGAARARTGWSNGIFDLNNDGRKDLFAACGGVMDIEGTDKANVPQGNLIMANLGGGKFADVTAAAGEAVQRKAVHRGVAFGDLDNDGRIDAVLSELHGPLRVWRNTSPAANHWILVKTTGRASNRDGLGARIKIVTDSGTQYNTVSPAVGYACSSDRRVHFGLGKDTEIRELEVLWPSGKVQQLRNVPADRVLTIEER